MEFIENMENQYICWFLQLTDKLYKSVKYLSNLLTWIFPVKHILKFALLTRQMELWAVTLIYDVVCRALQ